MEKIFVVFHESCIFYGSIDEYCSNERIDSIWKTKEEAEHRINARSFINPRIQEISFGEIL